MTEKNYTLTKGTGESYFIRHPEHSYGLVIRNEHGDIVVTSDLGYCSFSWRSFGDQTVKESLIGADEEYFMRKLEINSLQWGMRKTHSKGQTAIKELFKVFQQIL